MSQGYVSGTQWNVSNHRSRRYMDRQKANGYISIFPAALTSFNSFSICWHIVDAYSLQRGLVPLTKSWKVTRSESKRTAAWGGHPDLILKPSITSTTAGTNTMLARTHNAGWGASKFNTLLKTSCEHRNLCLHTSVFTSYILHDFLFNS